MTRKSWMLGDNCEFRKYMCSVCGYDIVVTQGKDYDYMGFNKLTYRYYCSNPDCKHHTDIRDIPDQADFPEYCKKTNICQLQDLLLAEDIGSLVSQVRIKRIDDINFSIVVTDKWDTKWFIPVRYFLHN